MTQLERWRGDFGVAYTDRNQVDWRTRVDTLKEIVPTDIRSVLEVGTNRGHNLLALEDAFSKRLRVFGVEPAEYARKQAREQGLLVYNRSVYNLPRLHRFDLVFTSGVLIHVPPERLDEALRNIYAASAKYVLAIEYQASDDTTVHYRGHDDMLWKRDYGQHYQRLFPDLTLQGTGDDIAGFDGATWWLLSK